MDCGFNLKNPTIKNAITDIVGENQVLAMDVYLTNTNIVDVKTENGETKQVIYLTNHLRDYICKQVERLLNESLDEDILNTEEYKKLQNNRINAIYKAMNYSKQTNKATSPVNIDEIKYTKNYEDLINKVIAKASIELYSDSHSSVNSLSKLKAQDSKAEKYGYLNSFERSLGVHFSAIRLLDIYNKIVENGNEAPADIANTLKRELLSYWSDILSNFIDFDNMSKEADNRLNEAINNGGWNVGKILEPYVDKTNSAINNYISVLKELTESEDALNSYYDEILTDPALKNVCNVLARDSEYSQNTEEEIRNEEANERTEEEPNENPSEDKDTTDGNNDPDIGEGMVGYDHSGRYNNYMKHVSQRLYNYFAALPIQNSLKDGDYKTDNSYGIPETMNPTNCIAILVGYCNSVSVKGMIQDIRNIAENFTGYASFNKLANDLEKDPDFAFELLTTLSKTVIDRLALTTTGGPVFTGKIINPNVNPEHVLHYLIYNEVKDYFRKNDVENLKVRVDSLIEKLNHIKFHKRYKESELSEEELKDINKEINYRIDDLVKIIREVVPSIDKKAILNYIQYNNAYKIEEFGAYRNKIFNINNLIVLMEKMTQHMIEGRALYINNQKEAYVKRTLKKNHKLSNNTEIDATANYNNNNVESYATDYYLNDADTVLDDSKLLRNALLPYYTVRLEFNSRDINGNLKSSIMNNSLLTTLNKLIKPGNEQALIEYGQKKLKSKQYLKSSILFDQYDSNGDIISEGLFHIKPDGSLIINEHNKKFFNFKLFEGASNQFTVKSVSYDKMTTADYLPSVVNMFNAEVDLQNKHDDYYGTYFLPIPSDAKNTFTVKGAKYNVNRQVDEQLLESSADAYVNALIGKTIEEFPKFVLTKDVSRASINYNSKNAFLNLALSNKPLTIDNEKAININDPEEAKKKDKGLPFTGIVTFVLGDQYSKTKNTIVGKRTYVDENGETQIAEPQSTDLVGSKTGAIMLKGTITKIDDRYVLSNHKIAAISSDARFAPTANNIDIRKDDGTYSPVVSNAGYALSEIYRAAKNYAKKQLLKGDVTVNGVTIKKVPTTINRNSRAFKILKNNFKQEIINAANAYDHYFKWTPIDNGARYTIQLEQDKDGVAKPVFRDDVNPNEGYKFYHLDNKGRVLSKTENGYTCAGKVFNSDKFTLTVKDENGNLVNKNFFEGVISNDSARERDTDKIDFFYGGGVVLVANYDAETGHLDIRDVNFTDKQNALIDKCLEEYIIALGQQGEEAVEENRSLNEDRLSYYYENQGVSTTGFDIAVNYAIQLMAYDDVLTGEGKFYKDAQTRLKRAKEYQASGTPYGLANFEAGFETNLEDYNGESFLNNGTYKRTKYTVKLDKAHNKEIVVPLRNKETEEIETETVNVQDIFAKSDLLRGVTQRNGFVGVTIANTQKTSEQLEPLVNKLVKNGLDENAARDLLFGPRTRDEKTGEYIKDRDGNYVRRGGFTETKVNDAQSYITFQEWVRRIAARGKLKRYMPLIESIINYENLRKNTDYESASQVRNLERARPSANMLKEFVQVQKNIYYDLYYDERYGIEVPRQIKNAEFVLIPFMIEGTELEQVYNMMQEAGIDQLNTVETSKAANETITTLWDNNGNIDGITGVEDIEAVKSKVSEYADTLAKNKQIFSYNNLYTQQETPQHANATNKFSLQISKKIIDNIQPGHPLYADKVEYLNLVNQQIQDSCKTLLNRFNIPMDEDGNVDLDKFNSIDKTSFYDSLKHELMRTGIDENLLKYVTIGEDGNPLMPVYMNSNANKFESIVQSVFNNHITRQTLPGFHAAQVANTGWKGINTKVDGVGYCKELKYHPNDENYIEVMVPYSFLGVNKSSEHYRQLSDEDILKELANKGLDTVIGYRIPTEGKQSACNMKIVGFVDDTFGSTIIVPDEWVAQTGSDFDIDSVYSITSDFYAKPNGELVRYNYTKGADRSFRSYKNKVTKAALNANEGNELKSFKDKYKAKIDELKTKQQEEYDKLQEEESKAYNNLIDDTKEIFKEIAAKIKADNKNNNKSKQENYYTLLTNYISITKELIDNNHVQLEEEMSYSGDERDDEFIEIIKENIKSLEDFKNACTNIQEFIENQNDTYQEKKSKIKEELNEEEVKEYSELGEQLGIGTFEDYQNPNNDYKYNNRHQRNSRIFDLMMKILGDNTSMEENLSRSNFDDLVAARNELMSKDAKTELRGRSSYNIFDQIKFQSDATSGMSLKGMSVSLDTFCSVCNTAQAYTSYPLAVRYNLSSFDNFNKEAYSPLNDGLVFHDKYGWSGNNKAVNGKILTSYSSQTTAYILDAIKEGALPGVNAYTFGAFKYMANLGIDYHVSVGFMMLPGVAEIVKNQRDNVSIFNEDYINPTDESITTICDRLGIYREEGDNSITLLDKVEKQYGTEIKAMFGINLNDEDFTIVTRSNKQIAKMVFDQQLIRDRIKGEGVFAENSSPVEENNNSNPAVVNQCLFDIGTILQFNFLRDIAHQTSAVAQCVKPDKFGAKQTIFSTRDIFRTIDTLLYEKINMGYSKLTGNVVYNKRKQKPVLYTKQLVEHVTEKGNKVTKEEQVNLLEAIYPGLDESSYSVEDMINNLVSTNNIKNSVYPTLYSYLKYSTAISCVMAKQVFDTEKEGFVKLIDGFRSVTNDIHKPIDEATYTDLKKYILSSMYAQCPSICQPFSLSFVDGEAQFEIIQSNDPAENQKLIAEEKDRVFGYNKGEVEDTGNIYRVNDDGSEISDGKLTIANVINPTPLEIKGFNQLSAGQKVQFIKRNFADSGIFGKLKVVFYNGNNRPKFTGMHSIEYTEGYESLDVARDEFKKALFNTNPLIKSAAIDLIKYASYFEGFRMSATAVNKIIDFDGLLASTEDGGIGFIKEMNELMGDILNGKGIYSTQEARDTLYENYLRSHPNCKAIPSITVSKYFTGKYNAFVMGFDMVSFHPTGDEKYFEKLMNIGIVKAIDKKDDSIIFNKYIRATVYDKGRKKQSLYKINIVNDVDPTSGNYGIVLTPLTQLLPNENSEWSSREKYNVGALSQAGYNYLLYTKPLNYNVTKKYGYSSTETNNAQNVFAATPEGKDISFRDAWGYNPRNDTKQLVARKFDINKLAEEKGENGPTGRAIKTIQYHYVENQKLEANNSRIQKIYFVDKELGDYITNYGDINGSIQTINIPVTSQDENGNEIVTYEPHTFLITKINNNTGLFSIDPFAAWASSKGARSTISLKEALSDRNMDAIINRIDWNNANNVKQEFKDNVKIKSVDENITRVIKASNILDQEVLATLGEMTRNKSLLDIVAMGRNLGVVEFKNLYAAEEVTPDYDINVNYSLVEDLDTDIDFAPQSVTADVFNMTSEAIDYARARRSSINDQLSNEFIEKLRYEGVTTAISSIKNNKNFAIRQTANYVDSLNKYIKDKLLNFIIGDENLSIYDEKVYNIIKDNPAAMRDYMETVNMIKGFINRFEDFTKVDISSEDKDIQIDIDRIKKVISEVQAIPINQLLETAARAYADNHSTNPLIKEGFIDVLTSFWKTNTSEKWFHDIQENSNPLVQSVLQDVMSDIDARQKHFRNIIRPDYRENVKAIYKRATERNETINWDNLIDENGNWIKDYNSDFRKQLIELRTIKNTLYASNKYSVDYYKAKLKYDYFVATHCNQAIIPEYYKTKCQLEFNMLYPQEHISQDVYDDDGNLIQEEGERNVIDWSKAFIKYKQLTDRRNELSKQKEKFGLSEEQQSELDDLYTKIYAITNKSTYFDGEGAFTNKTRYKENKLNSLSDDELLYSVNFAEALGEYRNTLKELNDATYETINEESFDVKLKAYQSIVENKERRDDDGILLNSKELENDKDYQQAKTWLRKNTKSKLTVVDEKDEEAKKLIERINKAYKTLGRNTKKGRLNAIIKFYGKLYEDRGIFDANGILDASKLTNEELAEIKEEQQRMYNYRVEDAISDAKLIRNGYTSNVSYSSKFYKLLGRRDAKQNKDYTKVVNEINTLLAPYYDNINHRINLQNIPDNQQGLRILDRLYKLYYLLDNIEKYDPDTVNAEDAARQQSFIAKECIVKKDEDTPRNIYLNAKATKSEAYTELMEKVLYKVDDKFNVKLNKEGKRTINRNLFTYIVPKNENKWIDDSNNAISLLSELYNNVPSKYYEQTKNEMMSKSKEKYDAWFEANHVYNPYTQKVEPIECWLVKQINKEGFEKYGIKTVITATGDYSKQIIKKGKKNKNYDSNKSLENNYIKGSENGKYDNDIVPNQSEQELKDYIQKMLNDTAKSDKAKRYFGNGYLPKQVRKQKLTTKDKIKEVSKIVGIGLINKTGNKELYDRIGYEYDTTPNLPMSEIIQNKNTVEYGNKIRELKKEIEALKKVETPDENLIAEKQATIEEYGKKIREERKSLIDRDFITVFDNYLEKAAHYNAVQYNKQKLYFLQNAIKQMKVYSQNYGSYGKLKKDYRKDPNGNTLATTTDNNLLEQYNLFLNRLLFDQWKAKEGILTNLANNLQSFTSANYMMVNIRGGINNVAVGLMGMISEAVGSEYFGAKEFGQGMNDWREGIISFAHGGYDALTRGEKSIYSKQAAIIELFNVVDYDEISGVVRNLTLKDVTKNIRDLGFSTLSMGEHFMQNSILFSILRSHKIFTDMYGKNRFLTKAQYVEMREAQSLNDILTDEQKLKFEKFKEIKKRDKNKAKDYVWFRRDLITDFIYLHCSNEQIQEYIKKRNDVAKKAKEDFDNKENKTLWEQLEFKDGELKYVANSKLASLDSMKYEDTDMSQATRMLGEISEKVRKVNNKIHGVYNNMGAAYIEKYWFGSLVMQYHKHLPMGIIKRYMTRGFYSEFRQSKEKGLGVAIIDLLKLNWDKVKVDNNLTDDEVSTGKAFTFMLAHSIDYIKQLKTTWNVIDNNTKATIRRNIGDLLGVTLALVGTALLWAIGDDDDDMQESFGFNLMLYQFDRLASESFLYNPIGLMSETKKLMSTPIAAQSIVSDISSSLLAIVQWLFDNDYDYTYHSGRFAGQNKLSVYLQRRIPIYSGIKSFIDTPENNHYYKVAQNPIGILNIKDLVTNK